MLVGINIIYYSLAGLSDNTKGKQDKKVPGYTADQTTKISAVAHIQKLEQRGEP